MSHNLVRRKKTTSLDVNKINMFQFRYLCYFPCFGSAILGGFVAQGWGRENAQRAKSPDPYNQGCSVDNKTPLNNNGSEAET